MSFLTRYKISSNRPNDCTWMCRLGRSEAGCRSVSGRSRVSESPVPGDYMDVGTARPDEEYPHQKGGNLHHLFEKEPC